MVKKLIKVLGFAFLLACSIAINMLQAYVLARGIALPISIDITKDLWLLSLAATLMLNTVVVAVYFFFCDRKPNSHV